MYLKGADRLSRKVLNHLTKALPNLHNSIALQTDLCGYLFNLMQFCLMYLDDDTNSLLTRIADHCGVERNSLESMLRDFIAKEVVISCEQRSIKEE